MQKILGLILLLSLNNAFADSKACPDLKGRYRQCYSEIRPIKGEYNVEQYQESSYQIYQVEYFDDETGESRKDVLKTNGKLETRKETLPVLGVKVRIDSQSRCENNYVISDAKVYFLGAKVGTMTSKIFMEDNKLKSTIIGGYLGKSLNKLIICDIKD